MNAKKVGLHLDNWNPIDNQTKDYLMKMDPVCVTLMGTTPVEDVAWLHEHFPACTIVVRVYDGDGLNEGIFAATYSKWLEVKRYYPVNQIIVQLSNEPNIESYKTEPEGIERFYKDWLWGFNWIKNQPQGSEIKWGFTPMAPGNKDFPVIQDPAGTRTYMEYCQPLIAMCDCVLLHIYAEVPELVLDPWFGGRTEQYRKWCQDKDIWITESAMSVANQAVRGEMTKKWFNQIAIPDKQIKGVTQWIGNIQGDPSFDVNRHFERNGQPRPVYHGILELLAEPDVPEVPPVIPPEEGNMEAEMFEAFKEFVDNDLVKANPALALAWLKAGGITNDCLGGYRSYLLGQGQIPVTEVAIAGIVSLARSRIDELALLAKKA